MIIFYYWDLLQVLQDEGGWEVCIIVEVFVEYVCLCYVCFGLWVKLWVIFNEIIVFIGYGYINGFYFLVVCDLVCVIQVCYYVFIVYVLVVKVFCEMVVVGEIGFVNVL